MNSNLIIDSSYKKAIEICGVKATINNVYTKVLIKEANDEYGIDYKKIISSASFKQGDYVFINGVQYLIVDTEEQLSQSIYNVGTFRKTLPLLVGSNYKAVMGIVDRNKVSIMESSTIQAEYDEYNFIIPKSNNQVDLNNEIVWDGFIYTVISVDTTKEGLFVITGKNKDIYRPHTYAITLNETSKTLKETEIYNIVYTCTDNGQVVSNPQVTFVSSDENIATVSSTGVVNCLSVGNVTITCTFQGVNTNLAITVEAKPSIPVVSYSTNWSNNNGVLLRLMSSTTVVATKLIDNVADTSLNVNYTGDATFNSLLSQKKISIIKVNNTSYTIKNTNTTTVMNIVITLVDSASGTIIENKNIKLQGI